MDYSFAKKIILIIGTFLLMVSSISFVFGNFLVHGEGITLKKVLSKNIFIDDISNAQTIIAYKSATDISMYNFTGACKLSTRYLGSSGDIFYFQLHIEDSKCRNTKFYLQYNENTYLNTEVELNFVTDVSFYNIFLDLSNKNLENQLSKYTQKAEKNSLFAEYDLEKVKNSESFWVKSRLYYENMYIANIIRTILEKREYKYLIPVPGYSLPTAKTKIPNAGRPYRKDVTDGIHHSWDIDTAFGEKVTALDDGIIVRVVNGWTMSSLSNIRTGDITEQDKQRNLDIYRGNQVWIKTMKGQLVMYAHLNTIQDDVVEGEMVSRGQQIGTVGISGVPQADYSDYHLDFSVHENPYLQEKAGKNDVDDYMSWPWLLKGKDYDYIIAHQNDYFEK